MASIDRNYNWAAEPFIRSLALVNFLKYGKRNGNQHLTHREVVVLVQHVPEYSDSLRVSFGHRPNPKGYVVVKGEKLYARTYDKGWNQPNVRYWLDARLPYEKEEIKGNQGEISLNRIIGTEEHIKIALDVMEKGGEQ